MLAVPSPTPMPAFALRTRFDSSAWPWEPLSQDSGSARVWHLLGLPPALSPTGTYPRLDSVSSSLKLSAIVVDRAIKGSFFCTEPRIQERDGELACGSSLPVKHATMAREGPHIFPWPTQPRWPWGLRKGPLDVPSAKARIRLAKQGTEAP